MSENEYKLYTAPTGTSIPTGDPKEPWVEIMRLTDGERVTKEGYYDAAGRWREFGTCPTRYTQEALRFRVQQHVDMLTGRKR